MRLGAILKRCPMTKDNILGR
ncbi:MAG: hypothetical protein ACD_42C00521G0001, partial [uncultured bacterium]